MAQASQRLLGRLPQQIFAPGGSFRGSIRLASSEGNFMLTRRRARARGRLEAERLRRPSAEGAPVPRLIAHEGTWLAQDHVPGRLSVVLAGDIDPADRCTLAEDAVGALFEIGDAAAPARASPRSRRRWVPAVSGAPAPTAWPSASRCRCSPRTPSPASSGWPCPARPQLSRRPANAILDPDGRVVCIDWEHAGCRHGVEDFAWFSADKYFSAVIEDVAAAVGRELDARTSGAAAERLDCQGIFAAMHAAVRLGLILNKLHESGWQDPEQLLRRDPVRASRPIAALLLRNAADWAARSPLTARWPRLSARPSPNRRSGPDGWS